MVDATTSNRVMISVDRGLHALRYVSARTLSAAPVAEIVLTPDVADALQVIAAPGSVSNQLNSPGACVVLVAARPMAIGLELRPSTRDSELIADFRVETLSAGAPLMGRSAVAQSIVRTEGFASQGGASRVMGHLARRGDVWVGLGDWLGGPDSPCVIEGIQLECHGAGAFIEYQVLAAGAEGIWSKWCHNDEYSGSRQQARPLLGVRFRLDGRAGEDVVIDVSALFLSNPVVSRRGRNIEFLSPSAAEPLIGLRLETIVGTESPGLKRHGASASTERREGASRVRVFRASGSNT